MKFVLIVHKDRQALDQFVHAVREEMIAGFTMMGSTGFGRKSRRSSDEFQFSIAQVLEGRYLKNTTMFSIVPDERVERIVELIETHLPDINDPGGGLYAILPVDRVGGLG